MDDKRPIGPRNVPGTSLRTSSIAVALDGPDLGPPSNDDRNVALLRTARSVGITTYATGPGSVSGRAERLLAAAFPDRDPELVVLVRRSVRELAREAAASSSRTSLEERLRSSLRSTSERLAPQTVGLVEWEPSGSAENDTAAEEALDVLRTESRIGGWIRDASTVVRDRAPAGAPRSRSLLVAGDFSVLDRSLLPSLRRLAEEVTFGFFARDTLAGGRLDGTRFERTIADRGPVARPSSLRELEREFAPVLSLGFLSEGRRQTLAQASLAFVLYWPWVCSALVPLPRPERLGELVDAMSGPPLSEEAVVRLLLAEGEAGSRSPVRTDLK